MHACMIHTITPREQSVLFLSVGKSASLCQVTSSSLARRACATRLCEVAPSGSLTACLSCAPPSRTRTRLEYGDSEAQCPPGRPRSGLFIHNHPLSVMHREDLLFRNGDVLSEVSKYGSATATKQHKY